METYLASLRLGINNHINKLITPPSFDGLWRVCSKRRCRSLVVFSKTGNRFWHAKHCL